MKENRYVNKFIRSIEKKNLEIEKKLKVVVAETLAQKRKEALQKDGTFYSEDRLINEAADDLAEKYPGLADENVNLKEVMYQIESDHSINLNLFDEYLNMFNFSKEAQVQVLGYYIKKSTEAAEAMYNDTISKFQARYKTPEELREAFDALVKPSITLNGEVVSLDECDKQNVTSTEVFESYKCLGTFFAEDGTIVPQEYFSFFESLVDKTFIRLLPNQILMIEDALKKAYEDSLVIPALEEETVISKKFEQPKEKEDKLERYNASQIVKKYLMDEKPIKRMSSAELMELTNALSVLWYSDEYITKIQKLVLENNNLIDQEELARKYQVAQEKYLSDTEIAMLNEIENIIMDQSTLNNPAYNSIVINFELLKAQLIKMSDASEEEIADDLDMIMMAIEDLSGALETYKLSDYRFVPSLKTED